MNPIVSNTPLRSNHLSDHAQLIVARWSEERPLTHAAGVVRVADAPAMAKGRSRIPFEAGKVIVHSLSAAANEQVGALLKEGLHGAGLERL